MQGSSCKGGSCLLLRFLHPLPFYPIVLAAHERPLLRHLQVPEGKGENEFAFDGAWLSRDKALEVIAATHNQWAALVGAARPAGKKAPWHQGGTAGWSLPSETAVAALLPSAPTLDAALRVHASTTPPRS